MRKLEAFSIRSTKIIGFGDSVYKEFVKSMEDAHVELEDNQILVIASKVVAMEQRAAVRLDEVEPSEWAKELAVESKLDPRVIQLVINESGGEIFGSVPRAILARTIYGVSANAGIDLSNAPSGYALLLPRDPDAYAQRFHKQLRDDFGVFVPVIIADSRTIPLRRGTTGVAIGLAGIDPVIDERGQSDLYGYQMQITTRAVADNVATVANLLMGETNERTPFAIVKGIQFKEDMKATLSSTLMPPDQCIYFAPFMELRKKLGL